MASQQGGAQVSAPEPGHGAKDSSHDSLVDRPGQNNPANMRRVLAFVALLALATHFLYFVHFGNFYVNDSKSYITPASNLLQGHGFTDKDGRPETVRPPGYPLLIAPFLWSGANLKYLVLLQHLLAVLLAVATAAAAFHIFGSRRLALIAGILLAIDLPTLESTNLILSETLFTLTLALFLWLLWTATGQDEPLTGRLFICGLLGGASVLIRPVSSYLFLPAAAFLLLVMRRFKLATVRTFVCAFAVLPFLWAARNYQETGYFAASPSGGGIMLCCLAGGVLALNEPGDFNTNLNRSAQELENVACAQLRSIYNKDCSELSSFQKEREYMKLGREILLQHPFMYLRLTLRSAAIMMLDGGPNSLEGIAGVDQHRGIRLLLVYTAPALFFAFVGLWSLWSDNRSFFYLSFLTIGYFVAISSMAGSYSRYRVPIVPIYAILTATGINSVLKRRKRRLS